MDTNLFLIIFAALFILIAAAAVHSHLDSRKKRAQRIEELKRLSFTAIENPSPEVMEILTSLHRNEHRKDLRLRDLHERREEGYRVFLYDMLDYSGEDISAIVNAGVAIHSAALSLPAFTIFCRIEAPGGFAGLMKLALDRLIAMAGKPLDFSQHPAFHQKYYVIGRDEAAIRSFLREPLLALIAEKGWRTIEARGSTFSYDRRDSYDYGNKRKVEVCTREKLQEALELFRAFTDKDDTGEPGTAGEE